MSDVSIFTRILRGEIPGEVVFEGERLFVLRDVNPQAALHLLIVPKREYTDVVELAADDPGLLSEVVALAQQLADTHSDGHFRLIFNVGVNSGQTVPHLHAHVLSGDLKEANLVGR